MGYVFSLGVSIRARTKPVKIPRDVFSTRGRERERERERDAYRGNLYWDLIT